MRTTLTIDDHLAHDLKEIAHRSGKPFKVVVNETLRAGLAAKNALPRPRPYRVRPVSMGKVLVNVNLDKALTLADTIEDQEIIRKMKLRK